MKLRSKALGLTAAGALAAGVMTMPSPAHAVDIVNCDNVHGVATITPGLGPSASTQTIAFKMDKVDTPAVGKGSSASCTTQPGSVPSGYTATAVGNPKAFAGKLASSGSYGLNQSFAGCQSSSADQIPTALYPPSGAVTLTYTGTYTNTALAKTVPFKTQAYVTFGGAPSGSAPESQAIQGIATKGIGVGGQVGAVFLVDPYPNQDWLGLGAPDLPYETHQPTFEGLAQGAWCQDPSTGLGIFGPYPGAPGDLPIKKAYFATDGATSQSTLQDSAVTVSFPDPPAGP